MAAPGRDFHLRWSAMGAPQRPTAGVAEAMRELLAGCPGPALQLGVTPEIAHVADRGVALDWSADMVRVAWPGDTATHRVVVGDWLAMPLADGSAGCAFGDACLSVLDWPDDARRLLGELRRVVRPGGRLVLRCFAAPEQPDAIEALVAAARAGEVPCFGAFKLRFNMAVFQAAGGQPNSGAVIHDAFQRHVADRIELARLAGWTHAEIDSFDAYAGAASLHTYPTRRQIAAELPAGSRHRFVETDGYPLAERCPLLVVDFGGR